MVLLAIRVASTNGVHRRPSAWAASRPRRAQRPPARRGNPSQSRIARCPWSRARAASWEEWQEAPQTLRLLQIHTAKDLGANFRRNCGDMLAADGLAACLHHVHQQTVSLIVASCVPERSQDTDLVTGVATRIVRSHDAILLRRPHLTRDVSRPHLRVQTTPGARMLIDRRTTLVMLREN